MNLGLHLSEAEDSDLEPKSAGCLKIQEPMRILYVMLKFMLEAVNTPNSTNFEQELSEKRSLLFSPCSKT